MLNQFHLLKDGRSILLREAQPEDASLLVDIIETVLTTSPYTLTTPAELERSVTDQAKRIQQYANADGHLIVVALADGQIVGTLDFKNNDKLRIRHSGEFGMGIIPGFQGQGLGRLMLEALLEWAEQHPVIEKVCLGVYAENVAARALYQKLGFIEEGTLVKAIKLASGKYADEIRMYRWVK